MREIGPNLYGWSYAHVVTTDPQDNRALRHSDFGATRTESTGDRWDPSNYDELLQQLKDTLETATTVNCKEVLIRASQTIGSNDSYEEWRGGPRYEFSTLSPAAGYIFGTTYPVPVVEAEDLRKVWQLLSKAEAGELDRQVNIAIAVGQTLRPDSDAEAVIWRTYLLCALQAKKLVSSEVSDDLFQRAACTSMSARSLKSPIWSHLPDRFPDRLFVSHPESLLPA